MLNKVSNGNSPAPPSSISQNDTELYLSDSELNLCISWFFSIVTLQNAFMTMSETRDYICIFYAFRTSRIFILKIYTELTLQNSTVTIVQWGYFYAPMIYHDTEWLPCTCVLVLLWYNYGENKPKTWCNHNTHKYIKIKCQKWKFCHHYSHYCSKPLSCEEQKRIYFEKCLTVLVHYVKVSRV